MRSTVKPKVAIVIPAYNEERTIAEVVSSVKLYGEAIVVDDASTDNTSQVSTSAGAISLTHETNQGYDGALESGFRLALEMGCDVVITMDADGQHDPSLIGEFLLCISDGYDLVVGIRPRFQRVGEMIFSLASRWKWGVSDPLCGMKAYTVELYRGQGYFDSYGSIGTELTIAAATTGKRIKQIPIEIHARQDVTRFGNGFWPNVRLIKALFRSFIKY